MDQPDVVIARNRTYAFVAIILAPVFVVIGLWLLSEGSALALLIGVAAIAFFGWVFTRGLRGLFDKRPGLVIGKDSIRIALTGGQETVVAWHEMTGVTVISGGPRRFIAIDLREPERYRARLDLFHRVADRLWPDKVASPVQIPVGELRIGVDELVETLLARIEESGGAGSPGR